MKSISATAFWTPGSEIERSDRMYEMKKEEVGYTFGDRQGERESANLIEILAAAHAGCITRTLAGALNKAGYMPEAINAKTELTVPEGGELKISSIHLTIQAVVPEIDQIAFLQNTESASENCPLSQLLGPELISMEAELIQAERVAELAM